jgi:hypothetical protein
MPYITLCIGRGILGKPELDLFYSRSACKPLCGGYACPNVLACHALFSVVARCYALDATQKRTNRTMAVCMHVNGFGLLPAVFDPPLATMDCRKANPPGQPIHGYWAWRLTIGAQLLRRRSAVSANITTVRRPSFTAAAAACYRDRLRGSNFGCAGKGNGKYDQKLR